MADLTAINNKLSSLRRLKIVADDDINYLFNTMPTLQEWKQATAVRVGSRGTTSNPELLLINTRLMQYNLPARGSRGKAIREIGAIIERRKTRLGLQSHHQWASRRNGDYGGDRRHSNTPSLHELLPYALAQ